MRFLLIVLVGCGSHSMHAPDGGGDAPPDTPTTMLPMVTFTATTNSTRFVTREAMLAACEMQISGEPLAETMGRDLGAYSRDQVPPNLYNDPALSAPWVDIPGFSTAVESYEYSKQPMNMLAFESGAGTSLQYGPLVNPGGTTGNAAMALVANLVQKYAKASNGFGKFVFAAGTFPANNPVGDRNPDGLGNPAENPVGWPGIWPTVHVFQSFDPTINATDKIDLLCAITSDDNPQGAGGAELAADYECNATTLHLANRAAQIDSTITPGADGFATWKYGLWTINYLQVMHDDTEAGVASVDDADLAQVGVPGNTVVGRDDQGNPTAAGTYLGSSNIEGFQAQMFIQEVDNRAEDWLMRLTTANGTALSGFATRAAALAYDYATPLRWFPGRIAVTETADGSPFPHPAYAIASADSELLDLLGVALGYATMYALTDTANKDVGGSQTVRVYFDGDPFAADNQLPDGQATLHDRSLALMRVAIIDLDRVHVDPASGVLVDHVAMTGATPTRGHTIAAPSAAYTVIALRTVLRALSSQLELYSNNTPDTAVGTTPLDTLPIRFPGNAQLTFTRRVTQLLRAHADLIYDHLTDATGRAWIGWDVAAGAHVDDSDVLDAHTSAIRGLFAAYLSTGDVRYRDRAKAVFARLEATFYDRDARIYTLTHGADTVEYTPLRFALLQSTLRDIYELVATRPGNEALAAELEQKLGRLNKLVLNGWDDRNYDRGVPLNRNECVELTPDLHPHGGLQISERALTGEIGRGGDEGGTGVPTFDRDTDCVPEVDDARANAGLAASITFSITRQP